MQDTFLQLFEAKARADNRIVAAWLEGSFGRGNADRYSDLDIHMLLRTDALADFQAGVEAWLSDIQPLVLFQLLFEGKMVNALTQDGLRLDVWLHSGETVGLDQSKTRVLFASEGAIRFETLSQHHDPVAVADGLRRQMAEFWRCIALTPSVIGRKELIVSIIGLGIEINLLCDILINGYGIARDRGVKNLNQFLPDHTRQELEEALSMQGLSQESLAGVHLRLAHVLQQHGPAIAVRHQFAYPAELEAAVLSYVRRELDMLGLNTGL